MSPLKTLESSAMGLMGTSHALGPLASADVRYLHSTLCQQKVCMGTCMLTTSTLLDIVSTEGVLGHMHAQ
jgi:hypothetical protein